MSHMQSRVDVLNISQSDSVYGEFAKTVDNSGSNDIGHGILKRSSKLLEALFLVSNALPRDEKIRDEIRTRSLNFFSKTVVVLRRRTKEDLDVVLDDVVSITALIQVGCIANFITPQVSEMMQVGLKLFYGRLAKYVRPVAAEDILKDMDIGQQDVLNTHMSHSRVSHIETDSSFKRVPAVAFSHKDSKGHSSPVSSTEKKDSSRSESIIELVKLKHRVTVKDIQSVIKGFSQKTLQRELLSLVSSGVLKKEGERRWSVYSLRTNGNGGVNSK